MRPIRLIDSTKIGNSDWTMPVAPAPCTLPFDGSSTNDGSTSLRLIEIGPARSAGRRPEESPRMRGSTQQSKRLDRQIEHVTNAAHRVNDARCARFDLQLAPQPQHLDIDAAVEDIPVNACRLQQMLARERSLRRFEKGKQQGILTLAQRHRIVLRIEQPPVAALDPPSVEAVSASLRIAGSGDTAEFLPPQDRAHTGQQFPQSKRLQQIIIRAEFEANDAIDLVDAMAGHDDYRHIRMRSKLSQQVEAIVVAKPQVEKDQAWLGFCDVAAEFASVGRSAHRNALVLEVAGHHSSYGFVIINHDDVVQFIQLVGHAATNSAAVKEIKMEMDFESQAALIS